MPSKKQRRRRAKAFRHEYDLVLVDAEGNEVPVDPDERRSEREAKDKQRAAKPKPARGQASRGGQTLRQPPQPSWERALRRGGVMGALMLLAFIFLFKSAPIGIRLAWGDLLRRGVRAADVLRRSHRLPHLPPPPRARGQRRRTPSS